MWKFWLANLLPKWLHHLFGIYCQPFWTRGTSRDVHLHHLHTCPRIYIHWLYVYYIYCSSVYCIILKQNQNCLSNHLHSPVSLSRRIWYVNYTTWRFGRPLRNYAVTYCRNGDRDIDILDIQIYQDKPGVHPHMQISTQRPMPKRFSYLYKYKS